MLSHLFGSSLHFVLVLINEIVFEVETGLATASIFTLDIHYRLLDIPIWFPAKMSQSFQRVVPVDAKQH